MALFFRQRKPRGFNYQPRFYDPDAEAREERKKIVLGEKYRSPKERARLAEEKAGSAGANGPDTVAETPGTGVNTRETEYVPGAYLREHIAARRGNGSAADSMRRRRRKPYSMIIVVAVLALLLYLVWMWYFK